MINKSPKNKSLQIHESNEYYLEIVICDVAAMAFLGVMS